TLKEFNDLTIFLSIPALIALVVFSILLFFRTAPISYVAFNDDKVSPQRILSKSHKAMSQGKFIVFLNGLRVFWFMLLNAIIIGLVFFVYEWLVVTFLIPDAFGVMSIQTGTLIHYINDYLLEGAIPALQVDSEMMFIIWKIAYAVEFIGIIFAIIYFLKLSAKLSLTCMVANYALYEDLVDDKYNENKVAVGVYISKAKNKKIKDLTLKDVFAIEDSEFDTSKEVLDRQPLMDLNDQDFPDEVLSDDTDETSSEVQE
ncbi:MAG: hypothetical protein IKB98_02790, partial [Clostridia bacterium]|nr:hypothetical protein [Clostridia bacterium]